MKGTRVTHIKLSTLIRKASRRKSTATTSDTTQEQSLDEESSSESNESIQNKSDQLIPNLTFIAKNDEQQQDDRLPPPIVPRKILPSTSRSCSTEKQSKNNLNDLKKLQNNKKNQQTSEDINSKMDDSKKSTSDDNSIEEDIEEILPTASSSNDSDKSSPKNINKIDVNKRRDLFGISSQDSKFSIDDEELSGIGLTHHFFIVDEINKTKNGEEKLKPIQSNKPKLSETSLKNKSSEEANETATIKNLAQPSQSNIKEQFRKNSNDSIEKTIDKNVHRRSSSEAKSTETHSQESISNSTIKSEVPTTSDVGNFEKNSQTSEKVLPHRSSSNVSNRSEDTEKFEKSSTVASKSDVSENVSNHRILDDKKQQSKEQLERHSSDDSNVKTNSNSDKLARSSELNESENVSVHKSTSSSGGKLLNRASTKEESIEEFSENIVPAEKVERPHLIIKINSQPDESGDVLTTGPNESLTNQSTANEVSELIEESSDQKETQSLGLSSKSINDNNQQSSKIIAKLSERKNSKDSVTDTSRSDTQKADAQICNELIKNLNTDLRENEISKINKISTNFLTVPKETMEEGGKNSMPSIPSSSQEDDMDALKEKILSIKLTPKSGPPGPHMARDVSYEQADDQHIAIKPMEKVQIDFNKDILEDITEESEKISTAGLDQLNQITDFDNNTSNDFDSIVSLNMIQMLENKIKDLQDVVTAKDICLSALNMQLDAAQRRESYATIESFRESFDKLPPSGRDSSSLATNSTEYRGLQEELGNKLFDFHSEITQRDTVIEKLTESLQQSIQIREDHQVQIDKLHTELQSLRKQISELTRKPSLPPWSNRIQDQESNGQRLSEISIDLVSESDEDLDRNFLTDNEDRNSRHSRERKFSLDLGQPSGVENFEQQPGSQMSVSKQIEQFQKYLNPEELRIFFMVQKKFDDFLSQEIAKFKAKYDSEIKILADQMEAEKHDRDLEIARLKQLLSSVKNGSTELIQLRQELDQIHAKEMEDLRTYFEKKCADLEKQYSEEIFSQHSLRNDVQSDVSDQENLPHDDSPIKNQTSSKTKETNIRKRTREELYASPSHRQMTPTAISPERNQRKSSLIEENAKEGEPDIDVNELKTFYKEKIQELNDKHEKIVKNLNEKLKRFESKYADDEFMNKSDPTTATSGITKSAVVNAYAQPEQMSSYIIIDEDEMMNDGNEIEKIAAEYERRLVEQVQLAKEDLFKELEAQIQALLSETAAEDQHWPPELILLREKFTAKSQLEIAQLQIKHEEEMARLKAKYEKQLNRKIKRQSTFDLSRDLDTIISERNSLRELSLAFRNVTSELAKCVSLCEDDFNSTFLEDLQKLSISQHGQSTLIGDISNVSESGDNLDNSFFNEPLMKKLIFETTLQKRLVPDVSSLLNVVDDPELLMYISTNTDSNDNKSPNTILTSDKFNLKDCIEKLKNEAQMLLELSENLFQKKQLNDSDLPTTTNEEEKQDACEEDGLRNTRSPKKVLRANSMNENLLRADSERQSNYLSHLSSLPPDLNKIVNFELNLEDYTSSGGPVSELNFHVNELRSRLVKSESDKVKLQQELNATIKRNCELGVELAALRDQLEHLDSNREEYTEGYGIGDIKSPQRMKNIKHSNNFAQLQEKARNLLGTPKKTNDADILLQIIEDFCREGDKVIECGKKDHDDLQAQIDAADKQLKATRVFLEEQAAERELERDEFVKEIEKLKNLLRDKDKERTSLQNVSNENVKILSNNRPAERMEYQIKELNGQISEYEAKKDKLEIELKASIDKVFVLREIISDLETQVEKKSLNERVLNEKVKELESYTNEQNHSIEKLQNENEVLKNEIGQGYQDRITHLEDALRNSRPSSEQSALLRQFGEQLRDISLTLEQKTKTIEALCQSVASISCSDTPREDISICDRKKPSSTEKERSSSSPSKGSPMHQTVTSPHPLSLPIEEIELIFERLAKHTRVEEAVIKRIKDLEMHVNITKTSLAELQHERDVLQEKMSEQMVRISSLQSKLDEQKRRAEDLQRIGSSDLNIRIHDLQNDLQNLTETLSARDKQILNLKNHLEQSKNIIDRQEAELAMGINSDRSQLEKLENELKQKNEENKKLREKIKSEMINKLALPDLMETMLADKNEEIDQLREQLETKDKELQNLLELNSINNSSKDKDKTNSENGAGEAKLSARTLSDIVSISEFDEPDILRKAIPQQNTPLVIPQPSDTHLPEQTMNTSKMGLANLTEKRTDDLALFNSLQQPPSFNQPNFFAPETSVPSGTLSSVPSFAPRQINFSEFINDSTPKKGNSESSSNSDNEDEPKSLKLKLDSARGEISELKISLERISKEKNQTVESLQKELEENKQTLNNLGTEKIKLEQQITELDTKIKKYTDLENEFKLKEENFKKLENEFIQLQLKLGQCEDCLDEKTKEITNLEKQIMEVGNENTDLKNKIENLSKNNNSANEIEILNEKIRKLSADNSTLQAKLDDLNALNFTETILLLNNQIDILKETVEDKDKILETYEVRFLDFEDKLKISEEKAKELQNKLSELSSKNNNFIELEKLTEELNIVRSNLSEKSILYEKCLLDIKELKSDNEKLKEFLNEKGKLIEKLSEEPEKENINEIKEKLTTEKIRNSDLEKRLSALEGELEKLKLQQNNESLNKQLTLDEIAQQVERELNYSAQLDSNILKAIESEEETNVEFKTDSEKLMERDLLNQLKSVKDELEQHKLASVQISKQLEDERKLSKALKDELNSLKLYSEKIAAELNQEKIHSAEIQQQDSEIIDALRIRLEEVLQKEQELHKLIDEEREKCNRLTTQISVLQHSEAKKASLMLKSPPDSPRKASGSPDFENNLIRRLKSEIELLTSQNKRERERMADLQKLFEREKSRFESELKDHIDHGESFKSKLERLIKEKDLSDQEIERLQEHTILQTQEIESLTKRVVALQEAETRRLQRREKERSESTQNLVDLQDLKTKLHTLEIERNHMNQTIDLLRGDVERSAKREAKLAEALASQSPDASIPQQFLGKMKEMNTLLKENMKELMDERKALQRKCEELENHLASSGSSGMTNTNELAERANHLLGRLLRVESHRKALVHQKRYLMISLLSYQESEAKAMALINGSDSILQPKRNLFKSVALAIIAIQRMKFIARRWQTGKRIVSKSVFTITQQKRAPLNATNFYNAAPISISPPCRDTNPPANATTAININSPPFQLQSPTLITEYVGNQHHHHQHQHQHQQPQPQKFDWSRLKK
ncbi:pericentrin isoform X2 [Condylostylus longicornis]|uniref:pericentrin isoform X2 n=1 Tax=Condylostylus longicornis TaxID=2530218 RepID=UPI00244DDA8E|nr:pericentrin isoform X2 [Condylostylus longicornis]